MVVRKKYIGGEMMMKTVLSIAGTDPSGGAGAAADCKTICAHGCFAFNVITAVVSQNTQGVRDFMDVPPQLIASQIDAVYDDMSVDAVKIGMVSNPKTIHVIVQALKKYKPRFTVIDPVMVATSGHRLLAPEAERTLVQELLPQAYVLTPNIPEAEVLSNMEIKTIEDMEKSAKKIKELQPEWVLIKGGHRVADSIDVLYNGTQFYYLKGEHLDSTNTHGTGCSLSSAIAANLAMGKRVVEAVQAAKEYVFQGILHAPNIGKGNGPIQHFYYLYHQAGWE